MSIANKRSELLRLQHVFEKEADQFHDLSLSILYLTQAPLFTRPLVSPNHLVVLWQYYGQLKTEDDINALVANVMTSNLELAGVRGSQFSCFALLEGSYAKKFMKMAARAGSMFSKDEQREIALSAQADFDSNALAGKSAFISNSTPAAVWLNYVLHQLGKTHPRYVPEVVVPLDPFAASLSAIDDLIRSPSIQKQKASKSDIETMRFKVALSFPGDRRPYVNAIANFLKHRLGENAVFYDGDFQAELSRPNLDHLLQRIYTQNSELIVIFLSSAYARSTWCGLEWRAVRSLISEHKDKQLMLTRFDDTPIPGLFDIDGYLDLQTLSPAETAEAILKRLSSLTDGDAQYQ